jgi:uncharacterized FlaG/YvyC family protein
MVDINPVTTLGPMVLGVPEPKATALMAKDVKAETLTDAERAKQTEVAREVLETSAREVEGVVNRISQDTSLSFRVEEDLSRLVVAVRAVGSDEIIRQFPPEEFITVAKHIAAQNPEMIDEDYLKGILFDQYT